LLLHGHGDFGGAFLHGCHNLFNPFHFNEQRKAAADGFRAECGVIFGDSFLVVEEDLDSTRP
jgi:hypothetical protein